MGKWNKVPGIISLTKQHKAKIFVETGTGKGDGVNAALNYGFREIYSVDTFKKAADNAKRLFANKTNVVITEDTSENFLNNLLPTMDSRPILFWLDAHFPGEFHGVSRSHCKDMRVRSPIKYELETIFREREKYGFPDIIAIDDLRMFKRNFWLQKQSLVQINIFEIQSMIPKGLVCATYEKDQGYILIRNPEIRETRMFL